jgi:hypothetical protein
MANGAAAAQLFELPATAPVLQTPKPKDLPATELEISIGTLTADAAAAVAGAVAAFETQGQLTGAVREWGGNTLAKLCEARLAHAGELDFSAVARREGVRILRARHGAVFRKQLHLDEATLTLAISQVVDWAVEISDKVARDELALSSH